jgi:hypothetical protein
MRLGKKMVHYAKVDWWLAALLGGAILLMLAVGTTILVAGLGPGNQVSSTALVVFLIDLGGAVLMGLVLWSLYRIRYEVTPPDLIVRFGPFRSRVPLDCIVEVFPTRNPLSAPAPSLDRLRIDYRRKNGKLGFTLISPKDKEGFVRDLASAAPHLRSPDGEPLRLKAEGPA